MRIGFAPTDENAAIEALEAGLAETAEQEEEEEEEVTPLVYFNLRIGSRSLEWRLS